MRLTCPACGAQYAPPEGAIPPHGRTVRCSACLAEWRVRIAAPDPERRPPVAMPQTAPRISEPEPARPTPAWTEPPRAAAGPLAASLDPPPERRGGFMAGFAVVSAVALAGVALYANAQAVALALPQAAGAMDQFVATVDAARAALADALRR